MQRRKGWQGIKFTLTGMSNGWLPAFKLQALSLMTMLPLHTKRKLKEK
jgi:hypothetical protein